MDLVGLGVVIGSKLYHIKQGETGLERTTLLKRRSAPLNILQWWVRSVDNLVHEDGNKNDVDLVITVK